MPPPPPSISTVSSFLSGGRVLLLQQQKHHPTSLPAAPDHRFLVPLKRDYVSCMGGVCACTCSDFSTPQKQIRATFCWMSDQSFAQVSLQRGNKRGCESRLPHTFDLRLTCVPERDSRSVLVPRTRWLPSSASSATPSPPFLVLLLSGRPHPPATSKPPPPAPPRRRAEIPAEEAELRSFAAAVQRMSRASSLHAQHPQLSSPPRTGRGRGFSLLIWR